MQWANVTFLGGDVDRIICAPLKTRQLIRIQAIGGDHAVKPRHILGFAMGSQLEVLIHNPLVNRR